MFVLVIRYEWLVALTSFIGAGLPTTTLFICSTVFLVLIAVQFSIKISRLTDQVKNLAQENALIRQEYAELKIVQSGFFVDSPSTDCHGIEGPPHT
jgi:hypothetical protein